MTPNMNPIDQLTDEEVAAIWRSQPEQPVVDVAKLRNVLKNAHEYLVNKETRDKALPIAHEKLLDAFRESVNSASSDAWRLLRWDYAAAQDRYLTEWMRVNGRKVLGL